MKEKGSIFTTICWMIITASIVYMLMSYNYAKEIASDEDYYERLFTVREYSGDFTKLKKVMGVIEDDYLKEYDIEKLEEGAIRGLLAALEDPYTTYFNKSETESFLMETEGDYEGVGMYITLDTEKNRVLVLLPIEGSPAEEAGVLPGDYILEINDENMENISLEETAAKLKGISGSKVKVKFARYNKSGDEEIFERELERRKIELTTFKYDILDGNIGYITFSTFDENITEKFNTAYNDLIKDKKVKGLILDLRNNPGGLLDVATNVADKLLPAGKIVYTVDKSGKEEAIFSDSNSVNIPIIVLVNENSASASEIMAAAIKDYGGTIIGTTSYGKGLVQEFKSLKDGTYVKVTISEYFSPKGNKINGIGVEPHIEIEDNEETEEDEALQRAIYEMKNKIK